MLRNVSKRLVTLILNDNIEPLRPKRDFRGKKKHINFYFIQMSQFLYDVFTASFDRRDLRYHQFQHGDENYNFFSAGHVNGFEFYQ